MYMPKQVKNQEPTGDILQSISTIALLYLVQPEIQKKCGGAASGYHYRELPRISSTTSPRPSVLMIERTEPSAGPTMLRVPSTKWTTTFTRSSITCLMNYNAVSAFVPRYRLTLTRVERTAVELLHRGQRWSTKGLHQWPRRDAIGWHS